jgi:hypothetical protein
MYPLRPTSGIAQFGPAACDVFSLNLGTVQPVALACLIMSLFLFLVQQDQRIWIRALKTTGKVGVSWKSGEVDNPYASGLV